VLRADGTPATLGELRVGDAIIAATEHGEQTVDTVSELSIASADAKGRFLTLTVGTAAHLAITPTHHMAVGPTCCSELMQASDVRVGDTVWTMEVGAVPVARLVSAISTASESGLHSPVLTRGSFPIVDGVVTSFDSIRMMRLASYVLPLCEATGMCSLLRRAVVGE
jgi:hypothetical protein